MWYVWYSTLLCPINPIRKFGTLQYNEKYKRIKQNDLINHFSRELKLERTISKSTMSEILQESENFFSKSRFSG